MKDKTLAVLCHAGGFIGCWVLPYLGGILVPLIIWGIGKTSNRTLLDQHGKEAINFQISIMLYSMVITALFFGAAFFAGFASLADVDNLEVALVGSGAIIMFSLTLIGIIFIFEAICVIIAIVKAISEQNCHYPLTIRLMK